MKWLVKARLICVPLLNWKHPNIMSVIRCFVSRTCAILIFCGESWCSFRDLTCYFPLSTSAISITTVFKLIHCTLLDVYMCPPNESGELDGDGNGDFWEEFREWVRVGVISLRHMMYWLFFLREFFHFLRLSRCWNKRQV
jgi:hypothetical protein